MACSLLPVPDISRPLVLKKLSSSPKLWTRLGLRCPCHFKTKLSLSLSLSLTKAVYTHNFSLPLSRDKIEPDQDPISLLNERIRRDYNKRDASRTVMDSKEAEKYIQLVKEQQQRGLQKLKGDRQPKKNGGFSYKVDPYSLRSGDYVVHKKVGVGRFVGIKFDVPKDSPNPVDPNETKRPRTLSKLNDTTVWERRKTKGKVAIQKMVVDLMELYLHRLKQRRPPYPTSPSMAEFEAQFPYEPTPDQKQNYDNMQTKAEKEEHLHMIKDGQLDIIVGTHSLLGNRVMYNNLGLLVVDEEQRFGVKQKEKIASFKTSVDVLTLSATPIPRTLYLALTGFRDASLISTPPPERVPIKTHLSAYSKENVISAIKYELDRGGQVFYVLPRIKGLEEVMEFLEQSFPTVEIAIAHGKQYSKQLEETMEKFAQGEIKILICTNIVESGLDIQNANTIIVQEVQQFGIAQLYQLRGRVGRADKEAHAHLFYPDKSLLTDQALERLAALEECRELGQGFQLAERDMGIRGFGTIFGEQQTGDVGNVGIDLFFEMLFESLSKVEEHRVISVPYQSVQPYSVELLLKKLYVRRMAADLGIKRIYASGKMVGMKTNMTKLVFKLITESMVSDVHRNSLVLEDDLIKAELLLELPRDQLLNWIFQCLAELHASLPALIKY
ncbi:atp-dependent dna helicase [Quercus suber]|uniref:Atp-dependent dna helicase n=1 Tax=Quercus suber TaxID=58331 RepID=A0AAW0KNH0_QUESU